MNHAALDINGRDWPAHPLNLAHREGIRRRIGDPAWRNPPTPIPTPEERRAKEISRAVDAVHEALAIRSCPALGKALSALRDAAPKGGDA